MFEIILQSPTGHSNEWSDYLTQKKVQILIEIYIIHIIITYFIFDIKDCSKY